VNSRQNLQTQNFLLDFTDMSKFRLFLPAVFSASWQTLSSRHSQNESSLGSVDACMNPSHNKITT